MKYQLRNLNDGKTVVCKSSEEFYARDTAISSVKLTARIELTSAFYAFQNDPTDFAEMILNDAIAEHKHWANYSEDKAATTESN